MADIIPTGWSIAGIGDFNGDGFSDLLLRDASGTVTDWLGTGTGFTPNDDLSTPLPGWQVAGIGTFNADGRDDILWRHDGGLVTDWLGLAEGTFTGNDSLMTQMDTAWHVVATGDFNGDGRADILWRYDNGLLTDWLSDPDGTFSGNDSFVFQMDVGWHVAGSGDFNGDGRADILWRNDNGLVIDWLGQADGSFIGNDNLASQMDNGWHIAGTGDFNGDGRSDILWRHESGLITDWLGLADGTFTGNDSATFQPAGDWQITGLGDFNGDGRDDIIWRNDTGSLDIQYSAPDGTFIQTTEQLWEEALANVSAFFDELTNQVESYTPSYDQASTYDMGDVGSPIGLDFDQTFHLWFSWVSSVQQHYSASAANFLNFGNYSKFQTLFEEWSGFSANFNGNFGSVNLLDPSNNTFLFNMNDTFLEGSWYAGAPSPTDSRTILVTGHREAPSGYFVFDPNANGFNFNDGHGGGGATSSPLNTVLSHSTIITVGHHNIYLPTNMSADEQAAANAFIAAVATIDALIGGLSSTETLTVVETWTDSVGRSHSLPLTETAGDLQARWANTSFGLFTSADYSTLNGPGTNGTGRGSSNIGLDPNLTGNLIAGFNMDGPDGLNVYFQQYGLAAMNYLALHEVAHDTIAGLIMNFATADRTDVFIPGTSNWANENLANSFAVATMDALGLSLGDLNPTAGWQTGAHWTVNP